MRNQAYLSIIILSFIVMTAIFYWENGYSLNPFGVSPHWFQIHWLPEMFLMYLIGRYLPMRIPDDPELARSALKTSVLCVCGLMLTVTIISGAILTLLFTVMLMLPLYVGYRLETKP